MTNAKSEKDPSLRKTQMNIALTPEDKKFLKVYAAEQRQEIKERLGKAISVIPGKSESWLMLDLEDDQTMYFRGDNKDPIAFVSVNMYGSPEPAAFEKMTGEITKIYGEVLGVKPDHMYIKYDASMYWGWNGSNF